MENRKKNKKGKKKWKEQKKDAKGGGIKERKETNCKGKKRQEKSAA